MLHVTLYVHGITEHWNCRDICELVLRLNTHLVGLQRTISAIFFCCVMLLLACEDAAFAFCAVCTGNLDTPTGCLCHLGGVPRSFPQSQLPCDGSCVLAYIYWLGMILSGVYLMPVLAMHDCRASWELILAYTC